MKSREPVVLKEVINNSSNNEQQQQNEQLIPNQSQDMIIDYDSSKMSNHPDTFLSMNSNTNSMIFIQETKDPLSLLPGRRSFQNCNAAVERNYRARMDELNLDVSAIAGGRKSVVEGSSVTDEEMLERYKHLVALPRGPNQSRKPTSTTHQHTSKGSSGSGVRQGSTSGKHGNHSSKSGPGNNDRGSLVNKNNHRNESHNNNSRNCDLTGAELLRRQQDRGREDKYPMKKIRK